MNKLQDVKVFETIYPYASLGLSSPDSKNEMIQLRGPNVEKPDLLSDLTTAKTKCILTEDDLVDGLRVLLRLDGVFHPGILLCVLPPDIYGVLVDKERGNKPHIMPREEVIIEAVSIKTFFAS